MIIAGTGHRPNKLGGYGSSNFNKLVKIAEDYIKSLPEKPIIISGMALGWDQALAIAAINTNCELRAYIPFKGQESVWPKESQELYHEIIRKCTEWKICSEGLYSAYKMQKRNEDMVNDADIILAMYDGSTGGTANCINYAKSKGKQIVNLIDKFKE